MCCRIFLYFFIDIASNHPVHIITKEGQMSPSAFIPFCEFGGDMSAIGIKIDKFDVPVCNIFHNKILNDQLCYEVDLNSFTNKTNIDKELELGFYFVMDYNEDRQFISENFSENKMKFGLANSITESDKSHSAVIYLDTIGKKTFHFHVKHEIKHFISEPVKLIGEGEYNLNALKEIKVTDSFMGLKQHIKGCHDEKPFLNCTTNLYIDNVLGLCGCVPFKIRSTIKVRNI